MCQVRVFSNPPESRETPPPAVRECLGQNILPQAEFEVQAANEAAETFLQSGSPHPTLDPSPGETLSRGAGRGALRHL